MSDSTAVSDASPSSSQPTRTRTHDVKSSAKSCVLFHPVARSVAPDSLAPFHSFVDLMVPEALIQSLSASGFLAPSPVQQVGANPPPHRIA